MAIEGISEEQFKKVLARYLTPARAISDPAHLHGRQQRLRAIERAFNSPGKHVFIYGDRGVGKTSLAQSAAVLHQSSDAIPILIACDEFATFNQMIASIVQNSLPIRDAVEKPTVRKLGGLRIPGLTGEMQQGLQKGLVPPVENLNEAVVLLKYVAETHSSNPVVIIDEFDQVKKDIDRKKFADLIKQISDQEISLKFIFCGIGPSLENLIGVHLSTDRYIAPIELDRLSHDALWNILTSCANELGVEFGREELIRISQISDGFPYYVHLIGEHILWSMFDDNKIVSKVGLDHFDKGIRGAIAEAVGSLKQAYNLAIQKRADDYEEVLWAVAESPLLERKSPVIYEDSYLPIMNERPDRTTLDIKTFYQRMNSLKRPAHGSILRANKQGWYKFSENVMRGYVRLMAEEAGVRLGIDHLLAPKATKKTAIRSSST